MPIWIQLARQISEKDAILQQQDLLFFQQLQHLSVRSHLGSRCLSSSDLKLGFSNCTLKVCAWIIIFNPAIYEKLVAKVVTTSMGRSNCAHNFVSGKKVDKFLPKEEYFGKALYTFDIGQNDLAGAFYSKSFDQILASIPTILLEFETGIKVSFIPRILSE